MWSTIEIEIEPEMIKDSHSAIVNHWIHKNSHPAIVNHWIHKNSHSAIVNH